MAVGSQGNHQDVAQSATLDHEIYPHHSMMHSLLHKLQGYHPEQDLPQSKILVFLFQFKLQINS
jgi:hypothetical protein